MKYLSDKLGKILFMYVWVVTMSLVVAFLRPPYILSILIVYLVPALANFYWLKKSRKKILVFALTTTFLFAIPIELIARQADAWDVLSIFPRLFNGVLPIENLLYAFFNFLWPLSFYELIVDRDKSSRFSKRWKFLVTIYVFFSISIYTIFALNSELASVNYWVIASVGLLLPSILIYSHNSKLLTKILLPTFFFGVIFFVHEMVSLYLGHWWWPGEYLVTFEVFGNLIPLDDVIIWYVLSTPALIGGYEFFMDDDK